MASGGQINATNQNRLGFAAPGSEQRVENRNIDTGFSSSMGDLFGFPGSSAYGFGSAYGPNGISPFMPPPVMPGVGSYPYPQGLVGWGGYQWPAMTAATGGFAMPNPGGIPGGGIGSGGVIGAASGGSLLSRIADRFRSFFS